MSDLTRKEKVLAALEDGEWHEGYALCHPSIGGSEGLRRLRELRAEGHDIEKRRIKGSTAFEYRLAPMSFEIAEDQAETPTLGSCSCIWSGTSKTRFVHIADDQCPARPHPRVIRNEP